MPLYKLTEKRMKKRAREDEQGITQIKAAMREMGDSAGEETDTDESGSDGDEDEDEDEDEEAGWSEDSDDDEEDGDDDADDDAELDVDIDGLEDSDDDAEDDDEEVGSEVGSQASSSVFPISLEGALTDPIYASGSGTADDKLCVLCPDKSMKNEHMVKIHLESKGHKRAAKRYALRLTTNPPPPDADPREVVDDILADLDSAPGPSLTSTSAAAVAAVASASGAKSGADGNEEKNGESGKKRKRKMGKEERRAVRAEKLLAQAQAGNGEKSVGEVKEGGASEGDSATAAGLNRKARRLLARRNGEFGDNKPKAGKGPKAIKAENASAGTGTDASAAGGKKSKKARQ
ncbi:hypothetical protein IAU59_001481 [Kwoniella sp. CBS 9459]